MGRRCINYPEEWFENQRKKDELSRIATIRSELTDIALWLPMGKGHPVAPVVAEMLTKCQQLENAVLFNTTGVRDV